MINNKALDQLIFGNFLLSEESLNIEARCPSYKDRLMKSLTKDYCYKLLEETENFLSWIKEQAIMLAKKYKEMVAALLLLKVLYLYGSYSKGNNISMELIVYFERLEKNKK